MDLSSLPPDIEQFVQSQLELGKYGSATEVVCDAVRVLRERQTRLETLRKEIEQGIKELDAGEFIELDSDDALREFFEDIQNRGMQRFSTKQAGR
jgi:antitoxin ParD1/3/4